MIIPQEEESVGFVGDNKTDVKEFEITDKTLFDFNFKLDLKLKEHVDIVDLEKVVEQDRIILRWIVEKKHMPMSGMLFAQLRAFNEEGDVWHSEKNHFWIIGAINAEKYLPSPLPSEFSQMEQQVTSARNETVAAKEIVIEKANEIADNTQTVSDKTEIVLQKADKVEINTETVTQNTDSAIDSANIAAQALADLLAMLGTDIATLTDGKLTPSQVPAIAVTDTFVVNSESEMLALTAEIGDVCVRTDETKTYILQGLDSTILSHWRHLESPTNYADNAGHSATADFAEDANKINGHRVVYMTQSQYDIAEKDPNTVYMVGEE